MTALARLAAIRCVGVGHLAVASEEAETSLLEQAEPQFVYIGCDYYYKRRLGLGLL
jgi:hypothetical protein